MADELNQEVLNGIKMNLNQLKSFSSHELEHEHDSESENSSLNNLEPSERSEEEQSESASGDERDNEPEA